MAITKWIHLKETGSDPWVLKIYAAWYRAIEQNRTAPPPPAIAEAGLAITTRLNLLPRIARRMAQDFAALTKNILDNLKDEHIYRAGREGVALPVDNDLKYMVIADIHAFVSELDACLDGMTHTLRLSRDPAVHARGTRARR